MITYYTFLRSATNWREFAEAKKKVVDTGLSYEEARQACRAHNWSLSKEEREIGTMMEFDRE